MLSVRAGAVGFPVRRKKTMRMRFIVIAANVDNNSSVLD